MLFVGMNPLGISIFLPWLHIKSQNLSCVALHGTTLCRTFHEKMLFIIVLILQSFLQSPSMVPKLDDNNPPITTLLKSVAIL